MIHFLLLAVLAVTPEKKFATSKEFLAAHNMTITQICKRYKAHDCFVRKESGATVDELGFAIENGTYQWSLYGKR